MPIELLGVIDPEKRAEKRKAEAALKEIGGEPLDGSGFEDERPTDPSPSSS